MTTLENALAWIFAHPAEVFLWTTAAVGMWKGQDWLSAKLNEPRNRQILQIAQLAFNAIEEAARIKPLPEGVTKTTAFLAHIDELALGMGLGKLDPSEKTLAKAVADNLSLATKQPIASLLAAEAAASVPPRPAPAT